MSNCETDDCDNKKNHTYILVGCLLVGAGVWFYLNKDQKLTPHNVEEEEKEDKLLPMNVEKEDNQEVKKLIQKLEHKMEEPKKSKEEELLEEFKKLNLDELSEEDICKWHKVLSNLQ